MYQKDCRCLGFVYSVHQIIYKCEHDNLVGAVDHFLFFFA